MKTKRFTGKIRLTILSLAAFLGASEAIGDIYLNYDLTYFHHYGFYVHQVVKACDSVDECSVECKNDFQSYGYSPSLAAYFCGFGTGSGAVPPSFGAGWSQGGVPYYTNRSLTYYICPTVTPRSTARMTILQNPYPNPWIDCTPAETVSKAERKPKADICVGNPIYPLTGAKVETIDSGMGVGGLKMVFTYDSIKRLVANAEAALPYAKVYQTPYGGRIRAELMAFGPLWRSSLHRKLDINPSSRSIVAYRGDGDVIAFNPVSGGYAADGDISDTLETAGGGGFIYTDAANGAIESYTVAGQLTSIAMADGSTLSFTYSSAPSASAPAAGYLLQVADSRGRAIHFTYTLPSGGNVALDGRIATMTDAASRTVQISYASNGNLSTIAWPDGQSRQLLYGDAARPWALTGIVDELGQNYATFAYDNDGRSISTQHASGVSGYSVSYTNSPSPTFTQTFSNNTVTRTNSWSTPTRATLTGPRGDLIELSADVSLGYQQLASQSQPAGSGCAASNSASTFDANGNVLSQDDFKGQRTCFAYDSSNREILRVEGLVNTAACSGVTPSGATLPSGARKILTTWHPDWRLPVQVSEPLQLTTSVYHGQPDPFNGSAIASCSSAAPLPNGKPVAVLCKRVKQALLGNGSVDSSVPLNVESFTYDSLGNVLTSTDPLGRTTTRTYYASTSFTGVDPNAVGYTLGDLQSISNPASQVTQYPLYDKAGRVLQMIDPKGVVTDISYTPRGWVSTVTTTAPGANARTTSYTYDGVGQVAGVAHPDGSTLSYSYDAAHRLIGITDAKGSSISYTLDNAGNRIAEEVKDSTGALQRSIGRSFDALNRVQQVTGTTQ